MNYRIEFICEQVFRNWIRFFFLLGTHLSGTQSFHGNRLIEEKIYFLDFVDFSFFWNFYCPVFSDSSLQKLSDESMRNTNLHIYFLINWH